MKNDTEIELKTVLIMFVMCYEGLLFHSSISTS
jgi:hypothetical protein